MFDLEYARALAGWKLIAAAGVVTPDQGLERIAIETLRYQLVGTHKLTDPGVILRTARRVQNGAQAIIDGNF